MTEPEAFHSPPVNSSSLLMSSPVTNYPPLVTNSDDEVLVRVEGVSKKFCRSLKKSLWYGVCDIASELNPFGRNTGQSTAYNSLTTEDTENTERAAGANQRADSAVFLEGYSQAGLQMDSEKLASIRSANDSRASGEQTGSDSESVLIRDIRGKKESIAPDGAGLREGEFYAVRDVSFELRRGELRDPGTVRKRDFGEMPWCNQGAGLREETASMPRADWA